MLSEYFSFSIFVLSSVREQSILKSVCVDVGVFFYFCNFRTNVVGAMQQKITQQHMQDCAVIVQNVKNMLG